MSIHDFQAAFAKLVASHHLCESVIRDETNFFEKFELTEKEKQRLRSVIRQKGMSACCSLYRMNRVTPLYTQLSNTCFLLDDAILPLLEDFWKQRDITTLQFRDEVLDFCSFVMDRIQSQKLHIPFLQDTLMFESAINELSYLPEGEERILKFEYDIFQLLYLLNSGNLTGATIEKSQLTFRLCLKDRQPQLIPV